MKRFKNLVIGGIQSKVFNLILYTVVLLTAAYMALSVPLPILGFGLAVLTIASTLTLAISFLMIWNGIGSTPLPAGPGLLSGLSAITPVYINIFLWYLL